MLGEEKNSGKLLGDLPLIHRMFVLSRATQVHCGWEHVHWSIQESVVFSGWWLLCVPTWIKVKCLEFGWEKRVADKAWTAL